jgi:hypothetical protein
MRQLLLQRMNMCGPEERVQGERPVTSLYLSITHHTIMEAKLVSLLPIKADLTTSHQSWSLNPKP